jgi:hypothetical protein
MTASELIRKLNDLPPEIKIVVRGYENGYNDIIILKNRKITINKGRNWWDGEFIDSEENDAIQAVELFGDNHFSEQ